MIIIIKTCVNICKVHRILPVSAVKDYAEKNLYKYIHSNHKELIQPTCPRSHLAVTPTLRH